MLTDEQQAELKRVLRSAIAETRLETLRKPELTIPQKCGMFTTNLRRHLVGTLIFGDKKTPHRFGRFQIRNGGFSFYDKDYRSFYQYLIDPRNWYLPGVPKKHYFLEAEFAVLEKLSADALRAFELFEEDRAQLQLKELSSLNRDAELCVSEMEQQLKELHQQVKVSQGAFQ